MRTQQHQPRLPSISSKKTEKGEIRGAVFEGNALSANEVKSLADLPSKEQLLSSILGSLDSGASGIASMLGAVMRDIAYMTEEVAKKKQRCLNEVAKARTPEEESAAEAEGIVEGADACGSDGGRAMIFRVQGESEKWLRKCLQMNCLSKLAH